MLHTRSAIGGRLATGTSFIHRLFKEKSMFSRRTLSTMMLSTLVALPIAAHAQRYSVTVVGVAGSEATNINIHGSVVGNFPFSATTTHGFVNVGTVITDLGTLGGDESSATGINDAGEIVGSALNAAGQRRAFLYVAGAMTDLGTLGGNESRAAAINNRGDIVGTAQIVSGPLLEFRAFLLRRGVSMQDLGRFEVPDTEGSSSAMGINERRQVVGGSASGPFVPTEPPFHAFLYECEEMKDLGTLGGQYSIAYAINARGQVVGEASTPMLRENRAFLYYRGTLRNLGVLPGGEFSSARDINDSGQVVGLVVGHTGEVPYQKGFLYEARRMRDLNTLIDPASGWSITNADGINNNGQIAATGCRAGVCYALRLDPRP
jgi:probable HAF family extracellular repeat protein